MSDVYDAFVAAFNARNLERLVDLLAPDATAQVLGAPFPVEKGRDQIGRISLPYLLDLETGLVASSATVDAEPWVLLCTADGALDTAVHLEPGESSIERIEYVVAPHQPERLYAIGRACRLSTAADASAGPDRVGR